MGKDCTEKNLLKLWRAVIEQARRDISWKPVELKNKPLYRLKYNAKKTAEWWIGTEDFYEVCRNASLDPELTLDEFRRIRNGF